MSNPSSFTHGATHGRSDWLGSLTYEAGLALQDSLVEQITQNTAEERLLLLEHLPVFTIGRTRDQWSLGDPKKLPYPVFETNRGGQATWHGPGQLVGYPLLDLRTRGKDLHRYLRTLEQVLMELLTTYGIAAHQREGLTGVWVEDRKIASIGIGVRHWISMHGFALNVCGPLDGFQFITPCGIQGVQITSIEQETGSKPTVMEVAKTTAKIFWNTFRQ